jgi:glycosyltransferase involved in cell wall biosynthesis
MVTYNHELYIKKAIDSVLMQVTNFKFKLIIGEDCSTDNTLKICKKYKDLYPDKIELLINEHNVGANLNAKKTYSKCLESGAKYIAMLEGDDYWTDPFKLQKQVDFLEENLDFTFSMGRVDILIEETKETVRRKENVNPEKSGTYYLKDYLKAPFSQTSSFVFRNSKVPLPDWFHNVHAGDQSLVVIKTGQDGKIKYHRDLFSIYRSNDKSISHTVSYNVYEKYLKTLEVWQNHLGPQYDLLFKINIFKYKQIIKSNKERNILIRKIYTCKIRIIDFILRFV